ncbi:tagaturonate reductase [Acidobacteria bacterium AH-259-G07]|nr:tagaturonate reductase [Acidobacteria bacterium AH-259-G07]
MTYPRLSKSLLLSSSFESFQETGIPPPQIWDLPEKVVQFGSGRFLRAFADKFIDRANREGVFNGRIVVVQSTDRKRADLLNEQNGLYTLCVRGLKQGKPIEEYSILASVSRALSANQAWEKVLECARNPDLELIISNTTEVGIVLDSDDAHELAPPRSFPGKLTAFLHERFRAFAGAPDRGLVLIPCELINNNGARLAEIVLELAQRWELGDEFLNWVKSANHFCNSLVDRIVTGTPESEEVKRIQEKLGYQDRLLTVAEVYSLWAIEGDESLKRRLHFAEVNAPVIVANDITPYRERKIRILNGTHTIAVPLAFLLGNNTILESMQHPFASHFIEHVMRDEIGPSLDLDPDLVRNFIEEVLQRFKNPYLKHELLDITFQSTSKMRLRVVPSIKNYYEKNKQAPPLLCLGFAFYLRFMKGVEKKEGRIFGRRDHELYVINDDQAEYFFSQWKEINEDDKQQVSHFVDQICQNSHLWEINLAQLPGFSAKVAEYLIKIGDGIRHGKEPNVGMDPRQWFR